MTDSVTDRECDWLSQTNLSERISEFRKFSYKYNECDCECDPVEHSHLTCIPRLFRLVAQSTGDTAYGGHTHGVTNRMFYLCSW